MRNSADRINRIIDANTNRAKEGIRVCEDIARFVLDNRQISRGFKKLRHSITSALADLPGKNDLIRQRDSLRDVGFNVRLKHEFKRQDYRDIFFANIQRVKESVRVLEEFFKLKDIKTAAKFKKIRYASYEIEKKTARIIFQPRRKTAR